MTEEKREQANEIRKSIDELKEHRRLILTYNGDVISPGRRTLKAGLSDSTSDRLLRNKFLPFNPAVVVDLYLVNLNAEIDRLELEFSSL